MEHREPPRIGPGERRIDGVAEEIRTRFRLRTFDLSENRRQVDFRRVLLGVLAGLVAIAVLGYLGTLAARRSVGWLTHQSTFQIPFQKIELVNALPSGSREVLKSFSKECALARTSPITCLS